MKAQLGDVDESLKGSKTHLIRSFGRRNKTESARRIFEKTKASAFFFQNRRWESSDWKTTSYWAL